MIKKEEYIAKVVDNNNENQNGSVQIYIPELMKEVNSDYYPWALADTEWTSLIPEVDDLIWVYFTDPPYYRKCFYTTKVNLKDYNSHNETIGSITGSYPNIKYMKLPNDVSIGMNSDDKEISFVCGDAEIYLNNDSEILIKKGSNTEIKINSSDEINLKAGATSLEASVLGDKLKTTLENLIDAILAITVTTPSGPSVPPLLNASTFITLKAQLSQILSPKVKNN